ncbi:hypothetical protein Taro_020714, partial [Colocasia esculenta]|nr:hypothetical protein [Colocasia esculenta]
EGDNEEVATEEEEEVGNGVEMEEENEEETSRTTPKGENEEQEVKGEEETCCTICLGRIASGAARWLRQKAEYPPCCVTVAASAEGSSGQQHSSLTWLGWASVSSFSPEKTKENLLLFFELYDPEKDEFILH